MSSPVLSLCKALGVEIGAPSVPNTEDAAQELLSRVEEVELSERAMLLPKDLRPLLRSFVQLSESIAGAEAAALLDRDLAPFFEEGSGCNPPPLSLCITKSYCRYILAGHSPGIGSCGLAALSVVAFVQGALLENAPEVFRDGR